MQDAIFYILFGLAVYLFLWLIGCFDILKRHQLYKYDKECLEKDLDRIKDIALNSPESRDYVRKIQRQQIDLRKKINNIPQ